MKRDNRLLHALVHFVIDRASLLTNHRISGRLTRAKYKHFRIILRAYFWQFSYRFQCFFLEMIVVKCMELILCKVVESFCSPTHYIVPHISWHDLPYHWTTKKYADFPSMVIFQLLLRKFWIQTWFCDCQQCLSLYHIVFECTPSIRDPGMMLVLPNRLLCKRNESECFCTCLSVRSGPWTWHWFKRNESECCFTRPSPNDREFDSGSSAMRVNASLHVCLQTAVNLTVVQAQWKWMLLYMSVPKPTVNLTIVQAQWKSMLLYMSVPKRPWTWQWFKRNESECFFTCLSPTDRELDSGFSAMKVNASLHVCRQPTVNLTLVQAQWKWMLLDMSVLNRPWTWQWFKRHGSECFFTCLSPNDRELGSGSMRNESESSPDNKFCKWEMCLIASLLRHGANNADTSVTAKPVKPAERDRISFALKNTPNHSPQLIRVFSTSCWMASRRSRHRPSTICSECRPCWRGIFESRRLGSSNRFFRDAEQIMCLGADVGSTEESQKDHASLPVFAETCADDFHTDRCPIHWPEHNCDFEAAWKKETRSMCWLGAEPESKECTLSSSQSPRCIWGARHLERPQGSTSGDSTQATVLPVRIDLLLFFFDCTSGIEFWARWDIILASGDTPKTRGRWEATRCGEKRQEHLRLSERLGHCERGCLVSTGRPRVDVPLARCSSPCAPCTLATCPPVELHVRTWRDFSGTSIGLSSVFLLLCGHCCSYRCWRHCESGYGWQTLRWAWPRTSVRPTVRPTILIAEDVDNQRTLAALFCRERAGSSKPPILVKVIAGHNPENAKHMWFRVFVLRSEKKTVFWNPGPETGDWPLVHGVVGSQPQKIMTSCAALENMDASMMSINSFHPIRHVRRIHRRTLQGDPVLNVVGTGLQLHCRKFSVLFGQRHGNSELNMRERYPYQPTGVSKEVKVFKCPCFSKAATTVQAVLNVGASFLGNHRRVRSARLCVWAARMVRWRYFVGKRITSRETQPWRCWMT